MIAGPFPNIPGYELLTRIGAGGMGHVFLARHHGAYGFAKLLAVKVIHPERSEEEETRAMFMDEARLLAQLDHPAIAQVFAFGESDDGLYLVMEYVQGLNFVDLVNNPDVNITPVTVVSMAVQICRGLNAAHDLTDVSGRPLNVVHRDIAPSNLVLTFDGRIKILDFGIALMRERQAPVTSHGFIRGKPSYLAPEQIRSGIPVDRRSDLYSLSIVMWELLTKEKLVQTDQLMEEGWQTAIEEFQPPSAVVGPLPAGLDEVVKTGLSFDANLRFQTAKEMAQALERIIEREGAESLEAFAERELASARQRHEDQLRVLLGGDDDSPSERGDRPITLVEEIVEEPEDVTDEAVLAEVLRNRPSASEIDPITDPGSEASWRDLSVEDSRTVVDQELHNSSGSERATVMEPIAWRPYAQVAPVRAKRRRRIRAFVGIAMLLLLLGGVGAWLFRHELEPFIPKDMSNPAVNENKPPHSDPSASQVSPRT